MGLGNNKQSKWKTAEPQERRAMVQQEIKNIKEESRKTKAVQMGKQGLQTRWTTPERSPSWADIWQYEPLRLKFLLRSVYDVLHSPVNLCQWNLTDNPNCRLYEERGTLDHILSSCNVALSQRMYRWRHDTVLRELAYILIWNARRNTTRETLTSPSFRLSKKAQRICQSATQRSRAFYYHLL